MDTLDGQAPRISTNFNYSSRELGCCFVLFAIFDFCVIGEYVVGRYLYYYCTVKEELYIGDANTHKKT